MFEIALSVRACLRSNTRADVAWLVSTEMPGFESHAGGVLLTPGGGRIGSLMSNAFDGQLIDLAGRRLTQGRIHELSIGPVEALLTELSVGATARIALAPAELIPVDAWSALLERRPVALLGRIEDGVITSFAAYTSESIDTAPAQVAELFNRQVTASLHTEDSLVSIFTPVTRLVIAGGGPIAEALGRFADPLGWTVVIDASPANVAGLAASLSPMDCIVVMGHDVEASSRCLESALMSNVGYIGALGSTRMQANRAEWLAYRDVTDLSRVHGPAGFDIGATTPEEIAISILAEALAVKAGKSN